LPNPSSMLINSTTIPVDFSKLSDSIEKHTNSK
jgi:hypothetical protein